MEVGRWREWPIIPPCREFNVVSFTLLLSMVEFKGRVTAGDLDSAMELLPSIPKVGARPGSGKSTARLGCACGACAVAVRLHYQDGWESRAMEMRLSQVLHTVRASSRPSFGQDGTDRQGD